MHSHHHHHRHRHHHHHHHRHHHHHHQYHHPTLPAIIPTTNIWNCVAQCTALKGCNFIGIFICICICICCLKAFAKHFLESRSKVASVLLNPEFPAARDQLTNSRLTAEIGKHQLVKIENTTAWSVNYSLSWNWSVNYSFSWNWSADLWITVLVEIGIPTCQNWTYNFFELRF